MRIERKVSLFEGVKGISFYYIETFYPQIDTTVSLYDAYKFNVMLSDGLAAILNNRNDIYNSFSGDVLFFSPSEIHHGRILRQGVHKYIEILIPTEYFPNYKAYYSLFNDNSEIRSNLLCPPDDKRTIIISLAEKIADCLKNPTDNDDIVLFSSLTELLKISCDLYSEKATTNQNMPAVLSNAITFIKNEYSDNIQITDIASAVNCSASYLSRIFKKHLGKSPYSYLTEYRLFIAEKLLRNGRNVTDAATLSGFCDSTVFIKCFKKAFGTTPLKYKKENSYE